MQSDGNSFCEDVVSDNFHKTSRYEDNILEQIIQRKCVWIIIVMILLFYNMIKKCILTLRLTKTKFCEFLVLSKPTSPQKPFSSDCITLYNKNYSKVLYISFRMVQVVSLFSNRTYNVLNCSAKFNIRNDQRFFFRYINCMLR